MPAPRSQTRAVGFAGAVVVAAAALGGCSWFDRSPETTAVSVFDVTAGQCFTAPAQVVAQLSDLTAVACTIPHTLEAFGNPIFGVPVTAGETPTPSPTSTAGGPYPGQEILRAFAEGACAQRFADYVGIDYRDSQFFYTYLLPSPRSWDKDDRTVNCFITTTGGQLTESLKGAKR